MPEAIHDFSRLFIELGAVAIGLALLARIASRWGISSISLFLLGGLAFGRGGIAPLDLSKDFIRLGAEIGVLLLLFMLGLEYSGNQLSRNLRSGSSAVAIDLLLNFPPGLIAGFLLHFALMPSILLGGITFVSSSGIIARVLSELNRNHFPETPMLISILVLEDLVMAVYLPLVAAVIAGGGPDKMALSIAIASTTVFAALFIATRFGDRISRFVTHQSDEVILLTVLGTLLFAAGIAQQLQLSAAIGAFLVGIAVSGPMAEQSHRVVAPLRDLFAATFFFFFGLEVDPRSLPSVLPVALELAAATALTKILTRVLVHPKSRAEQAIRPPSRPDAGCAWRVFHRNRRAWRGIGAAAGLSVRGLCAADGGLRPLDHQDRSVAASVRLRLCGCMGLIRTQLDENKRLITSLTVRQPGEGEGALFELFVTD